VGFALVSAVAVRTAQGAIDHADAKFVEEATQAGEFEVALGKVAAEKASSDEVKKYAQQIVDDCTKCNEELKTLAQSKGVDLTKAFAAAAKESAKDAEKLAKHGGADFDKHYMSVMVKANEKELKEFEKASKDAKDADVKALASKTLPTVQKHLETAMALHAKLGK
jgi:putative membrane protein